MTGQVPYYLLQKCPIYATSQNKYFLKLINARLVFKIFILWHLLSILISGYELKLFFTVYNFVVGRVFYWRT